MDLLFLLLLLLLVIIHVLVLSSEVVNGQNPPAPGYYPASVYPSSSFYQSFTNLWGGQHQSVSSDQSSTTIWLDQTSGSGFKSTKPYRSGYFGASIKLQSGYTAGVITSFYLSNNQAHPGQHDEVDIEFLGTIPGQPYTLQTNVYIDGSGDRSNVIGREVKFHLWFDPTADFHHYAILWNPNEIIFFVDNVPVRVYPKKSSSTFPQRPLWVYGSIWDASSWATDNGRYKADYRYQPFVAKYTRFITIGCTAFAPSYCRSVTASPQGSLSSQQREAMVWARRYHMVYDYCRDSTRDHSQTPECY